MTLISHEIPKSLFPLHDLINDYPYVLAHLVGVDKEYTDYYTEKCKNSSYSILDNSAFELGKSVDYDVLLKAAEIIKPTHLVIPDSVNNCKETIQFTQDFLDYLDANFESKYGVPYKLIAVLQGTNMEELWKCLNHIIRQKIKYPFIDTVALPFDTIPGTDYHNIRVTVFRQMKDVLLDNGLKVHLLGLQNYSEYYLYTEREKETLIRSVDSSAPIIYGWNGVKFGFGGTNIPKPKEKLADNLDRVISNKELESIIHNVIQIRKIIKGKGL